MSERDVVRAIQAVADKDAIAMWSLCRGKDQTEMMMLAQGLGLIIVEICQTSSVPLKVLLCDLEKSATKIEADRGVDEITEFLDQRPDAS